MNANPILNIQWFNRNYKKKKKVKYPNFHNMIRMRLSKTVGWESSIRPTTNANTFMHYHWKCKQTKKKQQLFGLSITTEAETDDRSQDDEEMTQTNHTSKSTWVRHHKFLKHSKYIVVSCLYVWIWWIFMRFTAPHLSMLNWIHFNNYTICILIDLFIEKLISKMLHG